MLPDAWDIPPDGTVVGGRGQPVCGAVVALSGVGGPGAHGGRVWVEREVGKGTAFHLELPVKEAAWLASVS